MPAAGENPFLLPGLGPAEMAKAKGLTELRHEFRGWPSEAQLTAIKTHFADWAREEEPLRKDIYVLCRKRADLLPKLRDGTVLEVKQRLVGGARTEVWGFALRSSFPLNKAARDWLSGDCGFQVAGMAWAETPHDFLCQISIEPGWAYLPVGKHRTIYTKGSLRGEVTQVRVLEQAMPTAAFETEDAERLEDEITQPAFAGLANRSYGEVLRDGLGRS